MIESEEVNELGLMLVDDTRADLMLYVVVELTALNLKIISALSIYYIELVHNSQVFHTNLKNYFFNKKQTKKTK